MGSFRLIGCVLLVSVVLFEKFITNQRVLVQHSWMWVKVGTPVIFMALGGFQLLQASVWASPFPPSVAVQNADYVQCFWILALLLLVQKVVEDMWERKDLSFLSSRDLRQLLFTTRNFALLAVVLS